MISYYADVLQDGRVCGCYSYEEPEVGPPVPVWLSQAQGDVVRIEEPINWAGDSPTAVLYFADGEMVWREVASVAELRSRKNDEINTCRELCNTDSFIFQGKAIRCKPLDRSDIDGTNGYVALFGEFPNGWQGGWKAADNTYVAISTIAQWKAFYKAMVDTGNANFRYAQQLKSLLAAAETPEQIAAIKWETPNV